MVGGASVLSFVDGLVLTLMAGPVPAFTELLALGELLAFTELLGLGELLGFVDGDSLGEDMTGLVSGVGVGLDAGFGVPPHGAAVVFFLDEAGDEDGDDFGLELAEAEEVLLAVADAVALAVDVALGLMLGEAVPDGERVLDGEPAADGDGDGDDDGVQDGTGTIAGACDDGLAEPSGVAPLLPPPSGLCATVLGAAAWPGAEVPVMALAVPLFAVPPPPVLELCPDRTEELSWTMAERTVGTAMATPAANTAQAKASAGRSIMSRAFQCSLRLRVRDRAPGLSSLEPGSPVARAGPERIFARMRSRPSGRGSTCSAAACNAERTRSAKSCG
jgi:hypothetical protein